MTKQESIGVAGEPDLLIRSLLDKQQYHDPLDEALNLGISSATWSLFGLLWPSGAQLAKRMALWGFVLHEQLLDDAAQHDTAAYKGRMLTYTRPGLASEAAVRGFTN